MKDKNQIHLVRYLFIALSVLVVGIIIGYNQITPTRAPKDYEDKIITLKDVNQMEADFRMTMSHDYQMSKMPHPSGSTANTQVQSYLEKQLKTIGCDYNVQKFSENMLSNINAEVAEYNGYIAAHPYDKEKLEEEYRSLGYSSYEEKYRSDIQCTDSDILELMNFIVKIDVPDTDHGIMFVSHYDSKPKAPGAADDLISVSAMLETLREMYQNKDELTNDLYFLFTDGEEIDLLGVKAYTRAFPEMKDKIALVLNIEARGSSGTILMFETSLNNKGIVKELDKALDHISMFSFSASVYRMMPNYTDLSEFLDRDYTGANFAMVGNPENYHYITDTYDNLDMDSAYMYHKTVNDLAHYFGTSDLYALESDEDGVYFPFLKGNTVIFSGRVMFLFSLIISILSLLWVVFLILRKEAGIKNTASAFGIMMLSLLGAAILGYVGTYIYRLTWNRETWVETAGALNAFFYALCFLTIIITLLMTRLAAKKAVKQTLMVSSILFYSVLNLGCALVFNSLAYMFTLPLCLLLLCSVGLYYIKDKNNRDNKKIKQYFSLSLTILLGLITAILFTPVIHLFYTALMSDAIIPCMVLVGISILPLAAMTVAALRLSSLTSSQP